MRNIFEKFASLVTKWSGSVYAFGLAVTIVIIWALLGPYCKYSDTWQLVINTGTTIITFWMVFLIQFSQNKEMLAVQTKLNELIKTSKASNKMLNIEDLSEEKIKELHKKYGNQE